MVEGHPGVSTAAGEIVITDPVVEKHLCLTGKVRVMLINSGNNELLENPLAVKPVLSRFCARSNAGSG
jgi:hypothetical protein